MDIKILVVVYKEVKMLIDKNLYLLIYVGVVLYLELCFGY